MNAADFEKCFEKDDCEEIRKAIKDGPLTVAVAAATYSKGKSLSPGMTRTILQGTMQEIELRHAIFLLGELLETKGKSRPSEAVTQMMETEIMARHGEEIPGATANRKELIRHIGNCPDDEFDRLLFFIGGLAMVFPLSDNIVLATLERAKRRLKDDRAFFLVLYAAIATGMVETLVAEITMDEVSRSLEAMAGAAGFPGVPGGLEGWSPKTTPSATDWVAKRSRKNYSRRRKR